MTKLKLYLRYCLTLLLVVAALGDIPPGYYDATAGKSGEALKAALNTILNTGLTRVSYGDARYILDETDRDPANPSNLIDVYLGKSVPGVWNDAVWNREHVWPQSLLGVSVDNNSVNVGSDLHNLKPCDPNENSSRGNKYFANQTTSVSYAPRAAVRGDIARILFYMVVMYETPPLDLELVNRAPNLYEMALLDVLLEWHVQDPVDDFERNRNEVIFSYQHNRNPFIDHPEFVDLIWGGAQPPAAPSQLSASNVSYTSLTLNWTDNSTDELGFRIYQNDELLQTTAANVTQYAVANLNPGTLYNFAVAAYNNYGESARSTTQVITLTEDTTTYAIFFSEYIEGSSNNKALEVVNGAAVPIALDKYAILSSTNNGKWLSTNYKFPTGQILNPGEVWVIAYTSADSQILRKANDIVSTTVVNFNGDDARALVIINGNDTTIIDVIGLYQDPAYSTSGWSVAGISGATKDHTLVRKPGIRRGNPDWASSAGTDASTSEWYVYDVNTFDYLGAHSFSEVALRPEGPPADLAGNFRFCRNYPNPFNSTTHLVFELPNPAEIVLTIYDLSGRQVEKQTYGWLPAGYHELEWSATQLGSGVYVYRLQAGSRTLTGKFLLIK